MSSKNVSHLTRDEIQRYLRDILHIDLTTEEHQPPSLEFLRKVYLHYHMYVPYSTVRVLPIPVPERTMPSIEDVRQCGLQNKTGLCYETNIFFSWVLIGLGYEVSYLLGRVYRFAYGASVNNHVLLVVHHDNVDYMVDPGAGLLLAPNLISLDFAERSPVYSSSLWDVRYYKSVDEHGVEKISGAYKLTEATSFPNMKLPFIEPDWVIYLECDRVNLKLEELTPAMTEAHKNPKIATVTTRLYCYQFPNGQMKMMRNKRFFWEVDGRKKCEKICETKEEVLETLLEHFGEFFTREAAVRAVDAYYRFYEEIKSQTGTK